MSMFAFRPSSTNAPSRKLRFRFDPYTDNYKTVWISKLPEDVMLVHVYSMRKRRWKLVTERFPPHLEIFGEDKVCGDGLHSQSPLALL
ncbi:hypothetical protein OSB04_018402 [Centaurea solstitialis]|uniref:Uncharacterized protein n=1 Tax=Centaurea solstitialis TaxID=347529 RepID=A0AA38WBI3_9ASTR|nr:hypothetical protein OSB04_018402 [Centaurea solstitialis]